ncbi:hypothetical protein LTR91_020886, partial [Friedmanniomyces endolithicus]
QILRRKRQTHLRNLRARLRRGSRPGHAHMRRNGRSGNHRRLARAVDRKQRVQRRHARHEPAAHCSRPPSPPAECDCALHQQPHQRDRPGISGSRGHQTAGPQPLPSSHLQHPPLLPQRADPKQLSQRPHHHHGPNPRADLDPPLPTPGSPNPLPRANPPHGSHPIPFPGVPRLGPRIAEVRRFQRKDAAAAADIGAGDVYVGRGERDVGGGCGGAGGGCGAGGEGDEAV